MGSLRGRLQLWKVCSHAGSTHEATRVGRTAGELFFLLPLLAKAGSEKGGVLLCGVGFSPIAGMVPVVGVQCIMERPSRAAMAHQHKVKGPTASLSYHLSYPCELPRPATFKVSIDINGHCVVDWRKGSRGLV